jgi:hypothetical protein
MENSITERTQNTTNPTEPTQLEKNVAAIIVTTHLHVVLEFG